MNPADYPRRILLAATGLTPQVVTETLYALAVLPAPTSPEGAGRHAVAVPGNARDGATPHTFIPTEIHLITTTEGAERARLSLLDPATGQFHALCRDYGLAGIDFTAANIHTIPAADGQALADIRTPEDNTLAADCLLGHVRRFCSDEDCALHVSIAGGRKTMGFFLGYALSLFGRDQDRLSHVLVSEPFESLTDFYFPPQSPRVLHTRDGRPVHTADAHVMLAEIPFVRLRDGLPREALNHAAPFAQMVAAAQTGVAGASLRFIPTSTTVMCGTTAVVLPPALFAFYGWLAAMRRADAGKAGFVRYSDVSPDDYLIRYAAVVGRHHPSFAAEQRLLDNGFDAPFFQQKRSKINRILRATLSLAAEPYLVRSAGRRPLTRYGIALPPSAIGL